MIEEDVENIVEEKSLFQESTLVVHEKTQDQAQFACEFCNFFTKRRDSLKRHIKSWHSTTSTVENQDFEEEKSNFDKEDDENILIEPRSKFRLGLSNPYQLHKKTLKRRQQILTQFKKSISDAGESFEELIELNNENAKKRLEQAMVRYLAELTVINKKTKKTEIPTVNTINFHTSNLKCILYELTNYHFGDRNGKFFLLYIFLK